MSSSVIDLETIRASIRRPSVFFLNPTLLFPVVWTLTVTGALLSGLDFYPLSNRFFQYLGAAMLVFMTTSYLGSRAALGMKVFRRLIALSDRVAIHLDPETLLNLHLCVMVVSLAFQCADHYMMAGSAWWRPEGLVIYRLSVTQLGMANHFRFIALFNYFFFSAIPVLWLLWDSLPTVKRAMTITFLLSFIYLSTSRSSFFTTMLLGGAFFMHYRPKIKMILIIGVLLFFAFQFIGSLVGKDSASAFWTYLFAPTYAADQILAGIRNDTPGTYYTFALFQPILAKLGLIGSRQGMLLAYYETPYPTNVYTVFGPFILDFGAVGSLFFIGLFGLVSGIIYGCQRKFQGNPYLTFLSALSLTILTLGVFYEYYTSTGYVWLSLVFSALLFPRNVPPHRRKRIAPLPLTESL